MNLHATCCLCVTDEGFEGSYYALVIGRASLATCDFDRGFARSDGDDRRQREVADLR